MMNDFKTLRRPVFASTPAVALSVLFLLVTVLVIERFPVYGNAVRFNAKCSPGNGQSCATCAVNGTVYGCTTPIPAGWTPGTCTANPPTQCTYYTVNGVVVPYQCGQLKDCTTGVLQGNNCTNFVLCQ